MLIDCNLNFLLNKHRDIIKRVKKSKKKWSLETTLDKDKDSAVIYPWFLMHKVYIFNKILIKILIKIYNNYCKTLIEQIIHFKILCILHFLLLNKRLSLYVNVSVLV